MPQFVAVRIVNLARPDRAPRPRRHQRINRRQIRHALRENALETLKGRSAGRAGGTNGQHSGAGKGAAAARTASTSCPRAFLQAGLAAVAQPVLEAQQTDIEPAAIARKQPRRVQQRLKELVIAREPDLDNRAPVPAPKTANPG